MQELKLLNPDQKKAVTSINGRILVLAGAGSGKTKVITTRIAYLIQEKKISPESILGLTFTNKAAQEMRERLGLLIGKSLSKKVSLFTFHSFCLQILRKEIHHLGFTQNFSLYDEKDIKRILKEILKDHLKVEDVTSLSPVYDQISQAKNQGTACDEEEIKEVADRLEKSLKAYNALDFDSLLTLTVQLFNCFTDVLEKYQDKYRYIMIDEYQDTNPIQFQLAESLAKKHNNLFVVGDDDQSIYGWRGADIQNILEFKADLIVKLQENYRSSQNILDAANSVIANNSKRHSKTLFSRNKTNLPITLFHAPDEQAEAKSVVERILQLKKEGYNFKDIAILYRSNILSRNFELELMQASWKRNDTWVRGIPYVIFGGLEFAERSEIKDLFAYLKLISNEKDEEALLRIINVPRRGISDKTLAVLTEYNRTKGISLWKVLQEISEDILELPITAKAKTSITEFMQTIHSAKEKFTNESLKGALTWFIEKIEMKRAVEEDVKSEKMRKFKLDNLTEVINSVEFYEEESKDPSLEDFISSSILARQNTYNKASHKHDAVQLMTFHSSKGLEFPVCFLCGLEDHILPHEKSLMQTGLEEERRLFYVAITRCREKLFMTMARKRKKMGKPIVTNPSRFLFEVPKNLLTLTSHKVFDK